MGGESAENMFIDDIINKLEAASTIKEVNSVWDDYAMELKDSVSVIMFNDIEDLLDRRIKEIEGI